MPIIKKPTERGVLQPGKKPTESFWTLVAQKPWLVVGIAAVIPVLILIAFTFKSGYTPGAGKSNQQLIVRKSSTELADHATEFLQKRDTEGFIEFVEKELGPNVNVVNSKGDPILLVAATLGNTAAVEQLILSGAEINKRNAYTRDTALLRALYYTENVDLIKRLVYSGADINVVNNYGQSPLFLALEKEKLPEQEKGELVGLFLQSGVKEGLNGDYLFRAASKQNHFGLVTMLRGGVDPNISNSKGNTPLIVSSSLGDVDSVHSLLAYRADVNAANQDGNTPLMYAARGNHLAVVKELLRPLTMQAPVDVNAQNKLGQTALYMAASKGYPDIVKRLIAANADTTIAANDGLVPYIVAQRKQRTSVLPWFEKDLLEVKNAVAKEDNDEMIAQAKAEGREIPTEEVLPEVKDEDIFKAAQEGNIELARRVIDQNKAAPFDKNKAGETPLLVAVRNGRMEMVDFLLQKGARLFEAADGKGNVLHIAADTQNIEMLKHLVQLARQEGRLAMMLEYQVFINKKPFTPLGIAASKCNKEMYDYLVSIGAKPGVRATQPNILGFMSPVDMMAQCHAKPAQAKQLTQKKTSQKSAGQKTSAKQSSRRK